MALCLHLFDCLLATGYLALLVYWYRVPWSPYYTRLVIIVFVLCFITFQSFRSDTRMKKRTLQSAMALLSTSA